MQPYLMLRETIWLATYVKQRCTTLKALMGMRYSGLATYVKQCCTTLGVDIGLQELSDRNLMALQIT